MDEPTEAQLSAAEERGRVAMLTQPRALAARYDPATERVVVDLANGCTFAFPPRLVQGLEDASDTELADVATGAAGFGLHWPARDVDVTVAGVMAGRFGSARYMVARFGSAWNAEAAE
jgi:hypothetical protein